MERFVKTADSGEFMYFGRTSLPIARPPKPTTFPRASLMGMMILPRNMSYTSPVSRVFTIPALMSRSRGTPRRAASSLPL